MSYASNSAVDRIAAILAAHPEITVHLAVVDDPDDDAAMVERVVGYVVKRSAEKRKTQ